MRRVHQAFAVAFCAILLVGCAGTGGKARIPLGKDAVLSPDGLHKVEGIRSGTLFVRPNYAFGSYSSFMLAPTVVSFAQGARVLSEEDLKTLSASFKKVARSAIAETGRREVNESGPCVALVTLGLADLDLARPDELRRAHAGVSAAPPRASALRSVGEVTLVLEVRDGYTREPLLRYGRRQELEGRSHNVDGEGLVGIFERFAVRFQKDFERSLSSLPQAEPLVACETRAETAKRPES